MKKTWLLLLLALSALLVAEPMPIELALDADVLEMSRVLQAGSLVALTSFEAPSAKAANQITQLLQASVKRDGGLELADRRASQKNQQSNAFIDEKGVAATIECSLTIDTSGSYVLALKAVNVATSQVIIFDSTVLTRDDWLDMASGRPTRDEETRKSTAKIAGSVAQATLDIAGRALAAIVNPFLGVGSLIQGDYWGAAIIAGGEIAAGGLGPQIQKMTGSSVHILIYAVVLGYSIVRPFLYNPPKGEK